MEGHCRIASEKGMESMKFMHIADVHLGVQPDRGKPWSEKRAREVTESFDRALAIAGEEQVSLLLIAGDLFHAPPTISQLQDIDYKLSKLEKLWTVIIAGNHDYMSPEGAYAKYRFRSKAVCLPAERIASVYIRELGVCVTGRSYDRQEIPSGIYDDAEPVREDTFNFLLAHGGDLTHAPLKKQKLLDAGFDYIALGHIHKPEILVQDKMAYAGSLEPIDYTDVGDRGYILGEITNGHCHVEWRKINVRNYINLSLKIQPEYSGAQIIDAIEKEMQRLGSQHIYRILLRGQKNDEVQPDFLALTERYMISMIEDYTRGTLDADVLLAENGENLIGQYILQLKDKGDIVSKKALEYGLHALLGDGDSCI